jgi:hypothetical protein
MSCTSFRVASGWRHFARSPVCRPPSPLARKRIRVNPGPRGHPLVLDISSVMPLFGWRRHRFRLIGQVNGVVPPEPVVRAGRGNVALHRHAATPSWPRVRPPVSVLG